MENNPTPKECRTGTAKSPSSKIKWDKPVSRAFFEKLRLKIDKIYKDLKYSPSWVAEIMEYVDLYLRTGEYPNRTWGCEDPVLAIFFCLKFDIDVAIKRSADCRRRAAERRARKEAERIAAAEEQSGEAAGNENVPRREENSWAEDRDGDVSIGVTSAEPLDCQSHLTLRSRMRVAEAPTDPVCCMAKEGK